MSLNSIRPSGFYVLPSTVHGFPLYYRILRDKLLYNKSLLQRSILTVTTSSRNCYPMEVVPVTKVAVVSPSPAPKLPNPNGYCCVIRFPRQKSTTPTAVQQRKELWKSRKWMERFAVEGQVDLTHREKLHLYKDVCRDTLWLACCPPCSASGMTNKLAFSAPRKPTYWPLMPPDSSGSPQSPVPVTTRDLTGGIKVFWVTTKRGHRIACKYIPFALSSAPVILYSHSNADDLGTIARHLRRMTRLMYCHVFAYDYSGYGLSEGEASIRNFYADAEAAYLALRFFYGFNSDDIFFYGSSLGSVAAAHLAAKYSCKGLIMVAAIPSGIRLMCRGGLPLGQKKSFPFDVLDNISLAKKIKCPALIVHGEEDQLCPLEGAHFLLKQLPYAAEPAFYRDVAHNEVELFRLATLRMSYFIHTESDLIWSLINEALSNKCTITKSSEILPYCIRVPLHITPTLR